LLSAVSAFYRNRIVLNNINKLHNIDGDINGMVNSDEEKKLYNLSS